MCNEHQLQNCKIVLICKKTSFYCFREIATKKFWLPKLSITIFQALSIGTRMSSGPESFEKRKQICRQQKGEIVCLVFSHETDFGTSAYSFWYHVKSFNYNFPLIAKFKNNPYLYVLQIQQKIINELLKAIYFISVFNSK